MLTRTFPALLAVLTLAFFGWTGLACAADEEFTAGQLAEIQRLMAEQREAVVKDTIERIRRDPSLIQGEIEPAEIPTGTYAGPMALVSEYGPGLGASSPAPSGMSPTGVDKSIEKIEVAFDDGAAEATLTIAGVLSGHSDDQSKEPNGALATESSFRYAFRTWEFTLAAPIGSPGDKTAAFATLDGLSSGVRAGYGRSWRFLDWSKALRSIGNGELQAECQKSLKPDESCSISTVHASLGERSREQRAFARKFFPSIIDYSVKGHIGSTDYDYITPTLEQRNTRETGYGASAAMTFVTPGRQSLYSLGATVQKGHKERDLATACPPDNGVDPVVCVTGHLGAPERVERRLVWAETRVARKRFGFSLKLTHDLESDETGVDFPIYLLRDSDKALTGGIRSGWTNEQGWGFALFLSKPFEIGE